MIVDLDSTDPDGWDKDTHIVQFHTNGLRPALSDDERDGVRDVEDVSCPDYRKHMVGENTVD